MWTRRSRDVVLRMHAGNLRVSVVLARHAIADAARRWQVATSSLSSRLWADYMLGTVMLSSFFKGEERIKTVVQAPTPSRDEIYVEAMALGEVRGGAALHGAQDPAVFRNGSMQVSKITYGAFKPYTTTVPASGHAESDWQAFYDVSEQIDTAIRIDHTVEGDMLRCCGLTVQSMPEHEGATPHVVELAPLRPAISTFSGADCSNEQQVVEYLNAVIPNARFSLDKCRRTPLDFFCRCSKQSFATKLAAMSTQDWTHVFETSGADGIDLTCHFCNEKHHFSVHELKALRSAQTKS